jgi:membrane protein implicated in regulation of membrane protease activity
VFVALGIIGVVLVVGSLLFDDVIEGLLPDSVLPDSGFVSGPVIGAFLAAFGIVGWALQAGAGASAAVAAGGGLVGGVSLGVATARAARALLHSPTDATPRSADLVGRPAKVITGVRAGGTGEVLVSLGGQPLKLTATAASDLAVGAQVMVVAVESSTKVVVEASAEFWGSGSERGEVS